MNSPSYLEAFDLEIEAIKKARQTRKNIVPMFPMVRTPQELREAIARLAKLGLVRGQDGLEIAMMAEVPANIFQAEEFFALVDRVSIGSNDLTQFILAKGRDNEKVQNYFDEKNPAVLRALEILIKTANRMGVKIGLCGQRPSNDPDFAATLVKFGIHSIGVVPEAYKKTVNVIAEAEKTAIVDSNISGYSIPEKAGNPQRIAIETVNAADIIKGIGIHPFILMQYAKGELQDEVLKAAITAQLNGKSVKEYVIDRVSTALNKQVATIAADKPVVYRVDDLDKLEYEKLLGGANLEGFDENPELGFLGMSRVIYPEYREFFAWQLEGIQNFRKSSGRNNVWVQLNIALLQDVAPAMDLMKNAGLIPGQDNFKVGLEISTAENLLVLREFIDAGIGFITESTDRFLSYAQAVDPESKDVKIAQDQRERLLEITRKIWTTIAEEKGIPLVELGAVETQKVEYSPEAVKAISSGRGSRSSLLSFPQAAALHGESVYQAHAIGFGNLLIAVKAVKDAQGELIKGALVVGANEILQDAGMMPTLKKVKEAKSGFKIAVWSKDKETMDKLKAMGVEAAADILSEQGLKGALKELADLGIGKERIVIANSLADTTNILSEFGVNKFSVFQSQPEVQGIRALRMDNVRASEGKINAAPFIVSRAIAAVYQDQETVKDKYQKVAQNSGLSKADLNELSKLDAEVAEIPLVVTTAEVAKDQIAYEEAVNKI